MSQTVTLGDQQITLGNFSGFKFLEAVALLGEIMEVVPQADEEITKYTQQWLAQNGAESVIERATAKYMFGAGNLEAITEEDWAASDQKLRLSKGPDVNAAFMRAFPAVYKHARRQVENLVCLIATPNSKLAEADDRGEAERIYDHGGPVHDMRRLVLHQAKLAEQAKLVLGSMHQLAEELQEAELGAQMGEFRAAVKALNQALNPTAASGDATKREPEGPSDESDAAPAPTAPASEPSSSTPSSPATPASPEPTSSTASPTAS